MKKCKIKINESAEGTASHYMGKTVIAEVDFSQGDPIMYHFKDYLGMRDNSKNYDIPVLPYECSVVENNIHFV